MKAQRIRLSDVDMSGGVLVFAREDIPSKLISKEALNIEGIFLELASHKKKWLLSCSYNLDMSTITDHA